MLISCIQGELWSVNNPTQDCVDLFCLQTNRRLQTTSFNFGASEIISANACIQPCINGHKCCSGQCVPRTEC